MALTKATNQERTVNGLTNFVNLFNEAADEIDRVAAINAATPGTLAASKAIVVNADKHIDELNVASLKIGATGATTAVTATAAELNILDGVTADKDEINLLNSATAGTQVASKAVIAGAQKEVAGLIVSHAEVADGTIPAYRLVKGHTDGTLIVGTLNSKRIVGANIENAEKSGTDALKLGAGFVTAVAAEPITAGDIIKCGDNGRILQMADADNVDTPIAASVGNDFDNQPTDDEVEILSSEADDTGIAVTIIGVTHGGHVLVTETIATDESDGTAPVTTTKTDWGIILAVKAAAHEGTLTIRKATGDGTITTLATGTDSVGVVEVPAADQGAHGLIPYMKAGGASTKRVGILYEPATGASDALGAAQLDGENAVALPAAANLVKEIYVGDVASTSTATVYTNATEDDKNVAVGKAIVTLAAGASGAVYLRP